ncbi:MAG: SDR family oxidoreductase [Desulfobacula sp.]|uniref:SDR family NAD(P)-dependent oxidoreductase n=1 Tax=Desulfobacula sp. TaxID=2593537 RepID=UPI0025B8792D|nr:SDR family oxidoreductase [Desulfobacula sp.]MCD4719586.1 SDR family oxidoreductase [Desulfobacula sp.]
METNKIDTIFNVKGKVALITGATGGFGRATAMGLALAGVKVMATGRTDEKLKPLVEEIKKAGGTAAFSAGSPIIQEDVKKIVDETIDKFGGIDLLITAAGVNKPNPIIEQPLEEWEMIMDANLKGTWLFCKEAGKVMIDQGRGGKVILLGSARGELGMANYSAYSPSKGAIHLLTKTLGCEWGKYNINVNAIAPTVFRTDLTQWMFDDQAFYKNFLNRIPIGRLGEPEDFLGTIIYLSSKASDFMTGAVLCVDGGYTAG